MATWHQQQHPIKLYHETEWTVVEDPPNTTRTLSTFTREIDAKNYAARVNTKQWRPRFGRDCAYVLKPATEGKR